MVTETTDALLVTSSFLPGRGGIESYLAELCEEVAPRLAVLAPAMRDGKPLPNDLPYPAIGYPRQMLLPGARAVAAIDAAALELDVDRILFGTPWPLTLLAPRVEALGYRYAFIVYAAELYVPSSVPGLHGFMLEVLSGADFVLTVSHYSTQRLKAMLEGKGLRVPPIERLPARVDLERFHPDVETAVVRERLGLAPDDRVLLSFGRLVARKGVHRLIDAMPAVTRSVPNAVLVIAGAGPEEKNLRRQAEASGARVVFAGRVSEEDAPRYFAMADVFSLPVSDRYFGREVEGLGVVMLEAGACGTPSVIGRSGGSPETVIEGETGLVVDARDRRALTTALIELLGDPERAAHMGALARAYVEKEFVAAPLPGPLMEWLEPRRSIEAD
ncbi:MAG: glycosyltransferase family 4 protein [Actinomycetota bacterium]|nr:glycosyltransferase family 4 protein [Actinomycetota bacterium]